MHIYIISSKDNVSLATQLIKKIKAIIFTMQLLFYNEYWLFHYFVLSYSKLIYIIKWSTCASVPSALSIKKCACFLFVGGIIMEEYILRKENCGYVLYDIESNNIFFAEIDVDNMYSESNYQLLSRAEKTFLPDNYFSIKCGRFIDNTKYNNAVTLATCIRNFFLSICTLPFLSFVHC